MVNPAAFQRSLLVYGRWLNAQNSNSAKRWSKQVDAGQEGAIAEAVVFSWLVDRVDQIAHGDPPGVSAPDFVCTVGDQRFYLEVTNISESSVENRTGLKDEKKGFGFYRPLTGAITSAVGDKAGQFKSFDFDAPFVVFVSTLQFSASCACVERSHLEDLLTGSQHIAWDFDSSTGEAVGEPRAATKLRDSVFVRFPKIVGAGIQAARRHVSAVVVGGFGVAPPSPPVYGVLHPEPLFQFNSAVLPEVPFGTLYPWPSKGHFAVRWSDAPSLLCENLPPEQRIVLPSEISFDDLRRENLR